MICIALYDEDINEAGSMETLLYEIGNRNKISVEITVFCSGEENEQKIILEGKYDLLYICTKRHVFALNFAKNIRSSDKNISIIFISDFFVYHHELFEIEILDYLVKPLDYKLFEKSFIRACDKILNQNLYFVFGSRNEIGKILISEILYFESNNRQINAYIINGCTETFSGQLKNIEKRLKNIKIPFLRIHQSYIVNFHMIRAYSKCKVRMVNGDVLSISSSYQRKFYEWYGTHIGDTGI